MADQSTTLRCILVDDEPLARERLRALLDETQFPLEIVGEAGSGQEAVPLIHEDQPDVVFLDVQMPVLDGFDVIDLLAPPRPHIVFVTAYDEYALQAFEVHALDYLTKPVRLKRLRQTLERVASVIGTEQAAEGLTALQETRKAQPLRRLTVHVGHRLRVVSLEDIRWIEASDKLVFAHLESGKYRTDFTLDELEHRLPEGHFLRIHRSYLVNADAIHELIPEPSGTYRAKLADGKVLPVARRRASAVKQQLVGR